MNRDEFFEKLSKELAAKSVQSGQDIISDLNAHFDEAIRDGKTEAEICDMLGDPAEIAELCVEEYTYSDTQPQPYTGDSGIYVDLRSANLVLEPHSGQDLDVRIERRGLAVDYGQIEKEFSIDRTASSLRITQVRQKDLASWLLGMFEIKTVVVCVPPGFYGPVQAKVVSGNLDINGAMKLESFSSEIFSGNTRISGLSCGSTNLRARSGNIKLERCEGDLIADNFSGNVSVSAHRGNVNAKSQSGNVSVETDIIHRNSAISTKSGGVKLMLDRLEANLELKCVSGNINFTIMNLRGNITAKTTSGNVTGNLRSDTRADFRLNSSGARNEFEGPGQSNGLPCVTLSSRSGIVRVKKI